MAFQNHLLNPDIAFLADLLRKTATGQTVEYAALGAAVGRPVGSHDSALRAAMKQIETEDDIVFGCIRGVGYRRLADDEIVAEGAATARSIRRKAARSLVRQNKVRFENLDRETQAKHSAHVSVMATVAQLTKATNVAKLAASVAPAARALPIAQTLRFFTSPSAND